MEFNHIPVLLNECIEGLNIKPEGIYVDGTLGGGGHSSHVLELLDNTGRLIGIDRDSDALEHTKKRLNKYTNVTYVKDKHENIKSILNELNIDAVDGILLDLGVSSYQLDEASRGFSYMQDAPLDMRMNRNDDFSAYDVINEYSEQKLAEIFFLYGEEKYSKQIARKIVSAREDKNIETTLELVEIIKKSMPMKALRDGHPARKTFQAIRIEVNHELDVLSTALEQAIDLLNVGGRLCVITFHSLEDRMVKNIFRKYSEVDSKFSKLPYVPDEFKPKLKIVSKGITPSNEELAENNRARSSRLRVVEKIKD